MQRDFGGLSSAALQVVIHRRAEPVTASAGASFERAATRLKSDSRVSQVLVPTAGVSLSRDGRSAVVQAGARSAHTNEMVRAEDALKGPWRDLSGNGLTVALTGSSGLWSDFNEANRNAMMKSELYSWPVTLALLVLAFRSLVAAAGLLYLGSLLVDISIWAMNFALMLALALGMTTRCLWW